MAYNIVKVKSVEGLDSGYTLAEIWQLKPILCVGEDAYEIVHPKMSDAEDVKFIDVDGKETPVFRLRRIRKFHAPNTGMAD